MANLIECEHEDKRGRKTIRVVPDCSIAAQGIIASIIWELWFPSFTEEQLDKIYQATWQNGLIRDGDAFKAGCYAKMSNALRKAGLSSKEAVALGTQVITAIRKEWSN